MPEKINATRFCDLQGVGDFDRNIIERKYRGQLAFLDEWHNTLIKEGFVLHPLKPFSQYMKEKETPTIDNKSDKK